MGDRLDNDVLPARAAGMRTVFVRRGPWGYLHALKDEASLADLRVDSLQELTAWLASGGAAVDHELADTGIDLVRKLDR